MISVGKDIIYILADILQQVFWVYVQLRGHVAQK